MDCAAARQRPYAACQRSVASAEADGAHRDKVSVRYFYGGDCGHDSGFVCFW